MQAGIDQTPARLSLHDIRQGLHQEGIDFFRHQIAKNKSDHQGADGPEQTIAQLHQMLDQGHLFGFNFVLFLGFGFGIACNCFLRHS